MARIGVGRGKLILFGEHAAVYGHPALGIPLDFETTVEISLPGRKEWLFPGLPADDAARLLPALQVLSPGPGGGRVSVSSSVPRGVGFGSSAALCVALAGALAGAIPPYGRSVWDAAHGAERTFHGTPSGIDTGLALLPGMRAFRPRPPGLPEDSRLPDVKLALVVGSVPRTLSTAKLVAELRRRIDSGEPEIRGAMARLGQLSGEAEKLIRDATPAGRVALAARLGGLADDAQSILTGLGLSTPELDLALRHARELGALGGKLSGAGGGGAFYLFAPDVGTARGIAEELSVSAAQGGLPSAGTIRAVLWENGAARGEPILRMGVPLGPGDRGLAASSRHEVSCESDMAGRAVVIGGGFAGLSLAALLARDGYDVELVEKNPELGGRARVFRESGFNFDMGPSWYLMPEVFSRFFSHFGTSVADQYELRSLDPSYRVFFRPEGTVDVTGDLRATKRLFSRFEPSGGENLERYLAQARYKYDIAMQSFLYRDYSSIFQFLNYRMLTEGLRMEVFSSLDRLVSRSFRDRRAKQILEYAMVFLGNSPRNAPGLYSIMSHVDLDLGVSYPMTGLGAVVEALVSLCRSLGVKLHAGEPARSIRVENGRAVAVLAGDREIPADLVASACDYAHTETALLEEPWRTYPASYWRKRVLAPSMFIVYLGLSKRLESLVHHNLYFRADWDRHFDTIFGRRSWPEEPCFYLGCPSRTDPSVAPAGSENLFVLVPVAPGLEDPDAERERYADMLLSHVEKTIGERIRDSLTVRRVYSHRDFTADYNALEGTALGIAHTLRQTAVFRPSHRSRRVRNLYYTGQYTHPGVGVPMTLIASEITRDLVTSS